MISSGEQVFSLQSLRQGISELWVGVRKELGENVSVVRLGQLVCLALLRLLRLCLTLVKSLDTGRESPDGAEADMVSLWNQSSEKQAFLHHFKRNKHFLLTICSI